MTSRERLTATLHGKPVDHPPVSFYEVGGHRVDPDDPDEFNIYNDPSWRPLLELAESKTDVIRMCHPRAVPVAGNRHDDFFRTETWREGDRRFTRTTVKVVGRELTSLDRRDRDVDTVWHVEHLLKDTDDLEAYLQLPDEVFDYCPDVVPLVEAERELGGRGIVMVDTADPLCHAAELFEMGTYLILAMTERELFRRLLDKLSGPVLRFTERVSAAFAGHLWRICGPEYAGEPYLPPELFRDYVVRYTGRMVRAIQAHGGFARIHMHGRLKTALPLIAEMHPDGLDPIEPPPQGNVELADVRREYGRDWVLFGNIEVADLENAPAEDFEKTVAKALRDGTAGEGRGFVLMPSACPYGRMLSRRALGNYRTMLRLAGRFRA
jgi:uroporphyrinogen-III decarboxylase